MEIKKVVNANQTYLYDFILSKDNLDFKIFFGGNLDLYWEVIDKSLDYDNYENYENKPLEFVIDQENMEVYLLFSKLYDDIINKRLEEKEESVLDEFLPLETKESLKKSYEKELDDTHNSLVKNGVISWHCDETYYEASNIVNIELVDDSIKITFIKQVESDYSFPGEISIRFRNSGSRYDPFNRLFMAHFNALQNVSVEKDEKKTGNQEKKLKVN